MEATATEVLIAAAIELDSKAGRDEAERMTLAWITDELVRRHPEAIEALDAWADDLDTTATYTATLLAAIR